MTQPILGFINAKTIKGEVLGYMTGIRYLAPAFAAKDAVGIDINTCPNAGACITGCLYTAGRARLFAMVNEARVIKTVSRYMDLKGHIEQSAREIRNAQKRAKAMGMKLCIRMNGTSDLPGDAMQLAAMFPDVQFYDYTKLDRPWERVRDNYHVTYSFDPVSVPWEKCAEALSHGVNVAVVFNCNKASVPTEWKGVRVIAGDEHDLRFLDPKGVIVGLFAKADAKGTSFAQSIS